MSAALQLDALWASEYEPVVEERREAAKPLLPVATPKTTEDVADVSLAFYRKHTEKMLRRYLYASMLVGRAPSILGEPLSRGWVSCRRVKTFEDAVIFVLDVERCLDRLGAFDRAILSRITLQEYSHLETAALLGMSVRAVSYKYPLALDRLTRELRRSGLFVLSDR